MGLGVAHKTRMAANASLTSPRVIRILRRATDVNSFRTWTLRMPPLRSNPLGPSTAWIFLRDSIDQYGAIEKGFSGHSRLRGQRRIQGANDAATSADELGRVLCSDRD